MSAVRIFTKASWSLLSTQAGALAVIALATFLTRALPLSFSPYPFNNDGLIESHLAANIIDTGHLLTNSNGLTGTIHSEAIPILNVLAAFVAASLGVSPFFCAQVIVSLISIVTVCGLFLLGRDFTGGRIGGMAASFPALFLGTFVFTTASFWKEALGFAFMVLILLGFTRRNELRYRMLCFLLLMILPFVHHLVTAITLLAIAFPSAWGLYLALRDDTVRVRHLQDVLMISLPLILTLSYYPWVSFDSFEGVSSPLSLLKMVAGFVILCAISFGILRMRKHSKLTFAPIVGFGIVFVMLLDYSGYLFQYESSVQIWYFVLVGGFAFLFTLAWYGTEIALEKNPVHRAVQLGLLLSPLALIGIGVSDGFSDVSHKLAYRTFDFVDIFMFLGCAIGVSFLFSRRKKVYFVIASSVLVSSVATFPFAYDSALLGVRHDSNAFEVDAIHWVSDSARDPFVVTDERLGYMVKALIGADEESSLPLLIMKNYTPKPGTLFILEDDWTMSGVNDFPRGLVVVPLSNFTTTLDAADVVYVGGPSNSRLIMAFGSTIGPYMYNRTPQL